ncbi:hypothetical protein L9F63_001320, partial [Diploptera punctata]
LHPIRKYISSPWVQVMYFVPIANTQPLHINSFPNLLEVDLLIRVTLIKVVWELGITFLHRQYIVEQSLLYKSMKLGNQRISTKHSISIKSGYPESSRSVRREKYPEMVLQMEFIMLEVY